MPSRHLACTSPTVTTIGGVNACSRASEPRAARFVILPTADEDGSEEELIPDQGVPDVSPLPQEPTDDYDEAYEPKNEDEPNQEQQRIIARIHKNFGHPDNLKLARLMTYAKAKPGVVKWIKQKFKCEECEATARAKPRRPATIDREVLHVRPRCRPRHCVLGRPGTTQYQGSLVERCVLGNFVFPDDLRGLCWRVV